jgi:cysteine-S-conjugate beta-lyase
MSPAANRRSQTELVHAGRAQDRSKGPVNPPIVRASTILHESVAAMRDAEARRLAGERVQSYGRRGTETALALEDALVQMEGGHGARLFSSGLAANALAFMALLRPGDHVVVAEGVYGPVKRFVNRFLPAWGIEARFVRADARDVEEHVTAQTRLIYLESPGSVLFEIPDLPRVAAFARRRGIPVAVDNTWGSAWNYQPLKLGADVSILAATKYLGGHSDVHLGAVVANMACWQAVDEMAEWTGASVSAEDAYLVLRGIRTMGARLKVHESNARRICEWLAQQSWVKQVFSPHLTDHPNHDIWTRDFRGGCGLLSFEVREDAVTRVEAFLDALKLFGLGASWGGYESLARLENGPSLRSQGPAPAGPVVRLHAGLEDAEDLVNDIQSAAVAAFGGTKLGAI